MFPYKNPITFSQSSFTDSVNRNVVYGNTFSILNIGGYMEVWGLDELGLILTATTYPSQIQLSANTIPINFTKGTGSSFSPDSISLNSDNISSGRRRLGMLVFVQETGKVYQYTIDNYEGLWNNLSGLTGNSAITQSDYSTIVNSRSQAGRDFIDVWTGSTIEGVSGVTRENARWRIFGNEDVQITGGTFNDGNGDLILTNSTGGTIVVTGLTTPFTGGTVNGLTANTISATTYQNLPLTSLSGLSDVSITSVSSGDTLVYSGSSWVNKTLSEITGEYNVKITTPSSIVSGTTSETQVLKLEIPPYSFAANDVLNIPILIISKVGTGASYTLRVKLSELSTMPIGTGTQTIASMSIGNTNIFTKLSRNFIINGGLLKGYPLSNNATDVTNSTSALREQAFDHTITNYLYVSVAPAFAGDTFQLIGLQINNL